ncbi:MAG: glycosyl hydrolase [Candidatus Cloacimonetes bacterium]|nr:glycosyl hydrolase [Candidatus Cloacimonadota bacterium]
MKTIKKITTAFILLILFAYCSNNSHNLDYTTEIIITAESGEKLAKQENVRFQNGSCAGNVIEVYPDKPKQKIVGIGTSFTESSAFVLAHLDDDKRAEVMQNIFGKNGTNFTLTRTHIGACDFTVNGKYSYNDVPDDSLLKHFNITPDLEGFDKVKHPNIKDENYDLLPMIKEALAIKNNQADTELKIIASAWTAPAWMKDIEEWYIQGSDENNWQGTGGSLKPEFIPVYADYLVKYLNSYKNEGVNIWGITPVNEPHGNNGQWESMHFTPKSQNSFIKNHLGPALHSSGNEDVKILIYDQNRDGMEKWTDLIFSDPETAPFVYGLAVHWYSSTFKVYENIFDKIHKKFPNYAIIHTEGCIDDLGKDASNGVADPINFKESGWFDNDKFWWNKNATDWAYSVTWEGVDTSLHPAYTPVHRYARDIIVGIDHWLKGWIDWNIVLNKKGGPNHVGNFCGAPIMIDTKKQYVYYTPLYYILAQFSKTIRPGDRAVKTMQNTENLGKNALHACATINSEDMLSVQLLNTTKKPIEYKLQIGNQFAVINITANSIQTVRIQL